MPESPGENCRHKARTIIIAILVVFYITFGAYVKLVLHQSVVYTHFAYIPIILSGIWWGRRGNMVAVFLAAATLSLGLLKPETGHIASDIFRVLFFIVISIFIGELKEKIDSGQRALCESEEKYRLLTEKTIAGIAVYRNDRVLFVNSRFADIFGYEPEEMVGMTLLELVDPHDRDKLRDMVYVFNSGKIPDLHYECRFTGRHSKKIWADVVTSMTDYEGIPAVLIHIYDISERKIVEEKRAELMEIASRQEEQLVHSTRLAELGEMAAAIAHEINQPLTGIRTFAKNAIFMIDQNAGEIDEVRENLEQISKQVDRASKIITQMRELARKSEQQFEPVNINAILKESVEFLSPQFKLTGVNVFFRLDEKLPDISGDRIRLEQVFLNLLVNARQSMEDSDDKLLEITTGTENKGKTVAVGIADSGKGFSKEDTARIFTPFYSTKLPGQGTGLGLSISLNIVKSHNGTVEASGEPGKGARFVVKLPAITNP